MRRLLAVVLAAASMSSATAFAGDKELCSSSYQNAQRFQRRGLLLEAKTELVTCLRECTDVARPDCVAWLEEVNRSLPTIVVVVRRGETDVPEAIVVVDGAPLNNGERAIELNPGPHRVEADVDGRRVREEVVLREGERGRRVLLQLDPATAHRAEPVPVAAPPSSSRSIGWPTIAFGALGGAALLTFGGLALYGESRYSDLDECRPRCSPGRIRGVQDTYLAADIALGVGVLSLGVAVATYLLSRHDVAVAPASARSMAVSF